MTIEKPELLGYSPPAIEFLMGTGELYGLSSWLVVLPEIETIWLKANVTNVSKFCSSLVLREVRKMMREQMGNEAVEIA